MFAKHIHNTYTFLLVISNYRGALVSKIKSVMTRVCVVYVLDKHIHAFILLIISIYKRVFRGRVYVWRLILKKLLFALKAIHRTHIV